MFKRTNFCTKDLAETESKLNLGLSPKYIDTQGLTLIKGAEINQLLQTPGNQISFKISKFF